MRAVVLDRQPRRLRIADGLPEPVPGADEVLVRVHGVGLCGSDLALHAAHRQPPSFPWILGHETFGEVEAAGDGVPRWSGGQRVVIEPNLPCLTCQSCVTGVTSACPRRTILGFTAPGTLAERVTVPARFAWPVPDEWDETDAVCAEPLAVALTAIRRAASVGLSGQRCLVIGAGSQGLLLCLSLVATGVEPAVLEPHQGRMRLAESLGAYPAADRMTGFGVIFETSGAPAALTEAVHRAAAGAHIMLLGLGGEPAQLVSRTVVRRQLTITGSLIYDHPGDFAAALAGNQIRPGRVLRACYPMTEAEEAFRAARGVPGKTWIRVSR